MKFDYLKTVWTLLFQAQDSKNDVFLLLDTDAEQEYQQGLYFEQLALNDNISSTCVIRFIVVSTIMFHMQPALLISMNAMPSGVFYDLLYVAIQKLSIKWGLVI